jgi:Fe-Mn family superoxide dismutase
MAYEVPPLPYDYNALAPTIDEQTMHLHHDKHHQAYVTAANGLLEGTEWADKPVDEVLRNLDKLPSDKQTGVRNQAGGHSNHSKFWEWMSPNGGGSPDGALADAINAAFGSFDDFKAKFKDNGVKRFGSGWTWLVRLGARAPLDRQPGQSDLGRQDPAARQRRVGARLLPDLQQPPPGLPGRVVERRELGQGGRGVRGRQLIRPA